MPNLAQTLKSEIRRLAKSEIKKENQKLKEDSARYRKDIADLKRQVADLTREMKFLKGQEQKRMGQQPSEEAAEDVRFSPKWLKSHRQKLGLSQEQYGKLVGVSATTGRGPHATAGRGMADCIRPAAFRLNRPVPDPRLPSSVRPRSD